MRRHPCFAVVVTTVALTLTGCSGRAPDGSFQTFTGPQLVDHFVGRTPGEIESEIQIAMSALRQRAGSTGQRAGRSDAIGQIDRRGPANPGPADLTDDEMIEAEAIARLRQEENPLYNFDYETGFRAGWQQVIEEQGLSEVGTMSVARRAARRDFEAGNGYSPERYGFEGRAANSYGLWWNAAERRSRTTADQVPTRTSSNPYDFDNDSYALRGSCFTAGTRVLMADGGSRAIEDVRVGDRVRGRDGATSLVTGIERPRLGSRLLYGFDGGRPFVTAEHPFMTAEGWKAIDPAATLAENPDLVVGALAVGDLLVRAVDGAPVVPAAWTSGDPANAVTIRDIAGVPGDPGMVLYNLLLDGDHSYFADGWLVHNKGR